MFLFSWEATGLVCLFFLAENLSKLEREEENFREQIEKLRDHAGDSWLTFYNEMVDEKVSLLMVV